MGQGVASSGGRRTPATEEEIASQHDLVLRETRLTDDASRTAISRCKIFMSWEIQAAISHYRYHVFRSYTLGSGGFGPVYKGRLLESNQDVAIKCLDSSGQQGTKEFVSEISTLCRTNHPNIIEMIGYCAEGDQRIVVYEFMPLGSLDSHLFDFPSYRPPLDWRMRMRIASGVADGLQYLHESLSPPVIFCDLKTSNILLGRGYFPKLSDFGLARSERDISGLGERRTSPAMGTVGYEAPEYMRFRILSFKIDIYCFGVVLLELITGRRAHVAATNWKLVDWARPLLGDRGNFPSMIDPRLREYPEQELNEAFELARRCIRMRSVERPTAAEMVATMNRLCSPPGPNTASTSQSGIN